MHSLYFIAYAVLATFAGLTIVHAQYTLYKREGKPFNFNLLKIVFGLALAMWTGAGLTKIVYSAYGA